MPGSSDKTPTPNNAGAAHKGTDSITYESYKQELNKWFELLSEDTFNLPISELQDVSKGMDKLKKGLYELMDNEFGIEFTNFMSYFNNAKSYVNAALAEYKESKDKRTPLYFQHLEISSEQLRIFIRQLAAEEALVRDENAEDGGEAQKKKLA